MAVSIHALVLPCANLGNIFYIASMDGLFFCVPGHVFCHDFCGLGQGGVCDVVGAWGEICGFAQICTLKMAKMGTLCTHESKMRAFFQKKVSKVLWFNKIALILPPVRVFLPKRVSESAVRQQRCGLCGSTRTSTHIYVI